MQKYLIILLLISSYRANSQDSFFYFEKQFLNEITPYFKAPPVNRSRFLKEILNSIKTQGLVTRLGDVGRIMVLDLETLSGQKSDLAFSWIREHGDGYFWYEEDSVQEQFLRWDNAFITKPYLNESLVDREHLQFKGEDFIGFFVHYVRNSPSGRIDYLSKNINILPPDVVQLFQLDLNAILEVDTPKFIDDDQVDDKKFNKSIKRWMSKSTK